MKKISILLIDDEESILQSLSHGLRKEGYKDIVTARNGNEGIEKCKEKCFELVITDMIMTGMNGLEVLKKVKRINSECKVILMSGYGTMAATIEAMQLGASDFILKPCDREEVFLKIERCAKEVELEREIKKKSEEYSQACEELKLTSVELKKSNENLEIFASVASHELKAPIRNIKTLGQFLKEDYGDLLDEKGKEYIYKIGELTTRLYHLIDNILEFSRLTKDPKPFESIDLNKLTQEAVDSLDMEIKETQGTVHIGSLPTAKGDSFLLLQLFLNIISNSLKFHRPGEPPVVNIRSQTPKNGFWEILIEDNGIGFDEKQAQRIMQPFKRLVSNDQFEGSGLGLATCQKIVDHHKGTITCYSQPGKGTTFVLGLWANLPSQRSSLSSKSRPIAVNN